MLQHPDQLQNEFIDLDIATNSNIHNHDIPYYNYPTEDDWLKLKNQLINWNLLCVYQTCIGNNIYKY